MAAEGGAAPTPHSSSNPPSADPAWAHEQFCRASQTSRRSFAEEDYLRRTSHDLGEGSGYGGSGQGSSSAGKSTNIPEVPVDIPRDGDPRVGPLDPFLTRRREKQPSTSAAFKNLKICKEKIGRATGAIQPPLPRPGSAEPGSGSVGRAGLGPADPIPISGFLNLGWHDIAWSRICQAKEANGLGTKI
ncbi:hypothetical protein Taro_042990 [Colocasia esculenta]|uniref:Uncharacterized protein n=1 Tax=Colocasia esculenta TaxID=4460 RepID=A0A843WXX1_COLES|nr:hypothetical protein [Colocasia esculenta]